MRKPGLHRVWRRATATASVAAVEGHHAGAAEAESKALELKRKAVTPELIMLDAVQKWDGKLPTVYGGGNGGMMQLLDMKSLLDKK